MNWTERIFKLREHGTNVRTEVLAGYPWLGVIGRETFIALPGITLEQLQRGDFVRVPARNRRVGQLLKDIRLAEARSSGLRKIRQAMERAGNSPPQFEFDEGRTYFKVALPIHPAHLPRARALPLRVGAPALATELVGRAELIEQVNRKLARRNVCLLAPRGRGSS